MVDRTRSYAPGAVHRVAQLPLCTEATPFTAFSDEWFPFKRVSARNVNAPSAVQGPSSTCLRAQKNSMPHALQSFPPSRFKCLLMESMISPAQRTGKKNKNSTSCPLTIISPTAPTFSCYCFRVSAGTFNQVTDEI